MSSPHRELEVINEILHVGVVPVLDDGRPQAVFRVDAELGPRFRHVHYDEHEHNDDDLYEEESRHRPVVLQTQ